MLKAKEVLSALLANFKKQERDLSYSEEMRTLKHEQASFTQYLTKFCNESSVLNEDQAEVLRAKIMAADYTEPNHTTTMLLLAGWINTCK